MDTFLPNYMRELALLTSTFSDVKQQTLIELLEKLTRGPRVIRKRKTLARLA